MRELRRLFLSPEIKLEFSTSTITFQYLSIALPPIPRAKGAPFFCCLCFRTPLSYHSRVSLVCLSLALRFLESLPSPLNRLKNYTPRTVCPIQAFFPAVISLSQLFLMIPVERSFPCQERPFSNSRMPCFCKELFQSFPLFVCGSPRFCPAN